MSRYPFKVNRYRQALRGLKYAADAFYGVVSPVVLHTQEYIDAKIRLLEALVLAAEVLPSDAPRDVRLGDCGCSDAAACARDRKGRS